MPSAQQIANGTYRVINGQWHKRCTGPAHDEPTFLPATEKYFYVRTTASRGHKVGELVSRCRLCSNWARVGSRGSTHGWLDVRTALPVYIEAVNRVGLMELSRRTGLAYNGITAILRHETKYVQKAKFRLVLLELISMRRKNEHSANNIAKWRTERRNNYFHSTCVGCGTPISNYTEGCPQCTDRRLRRNKVARAVDVDDHG